MKLKDLLKVLDGTQFYVEPQGIRDKCGDCPIVAAYFKQTGTARNPYGVYNAYARVYGTELGL